MHFFCSIHKHISLLAGLCFSCAFMKEAIIVTYAVV